MKVLFKYLKPYAAYVFLAFVLLIGQAFTDLSLPNLMSNLVNTGIQQSGIESGVPDYMSRDALESLKLYMNDNEKKKFESAYKGDGDKLELKDISKDEKKSLDKVYGNSSYSMLQTLKSMGMKGMDSKDSKSQATVEKMPKDFFMKINFALEKMPKEKLLEERDKSSKVDDMFKTQISGFFTKMIYSSLSIDLNKIQRDYILKTGFKMMVITVLGAAATIGVGLLAAKIGTGISRNLRKDVFNKVMNFSSKEYNKFSTASLITRSTNDIQQVQLMTVLGIRMLTYAPIMAIGGIIMALDKSISLAWIIALAVIAIMGFIAVVLVAVMPRFKLLQKLTDKLNLVSRENLTGLMVIRAFNTDKREKERFHDANKELKDVNGVVQKVMGAMMPTMMLVMNLTSLGIIWFGAKLISESSLQVGDMMAFIQYAMQIIMSFLMMTMIFVLVPRASVSLGRIGEVLSTEPSIVNDVKTDNDIEEGKVEFRNVSFKYDNAENNILENISFTAESGKTTAIIGSTGSGKSTVVQLIPRFFDVTGGQILIDGVEVKDYDIEKLRNSIGYVPQKGFLFQGDFRTNMQFGKGDATDDEIIEALDVAQSKDFVMAKENGIDEHIAQSGGNLSGGQKQRISIARALIKKAPIYIFDDTFSALDYKTDAKLRAELDGYLNGSTVIIVAQRINTIRNADKIIVMDKGEIVGQGTHDELMRDCDTYIEIANSQLSKEELE